jgi:hypothetical protein
MRTLHRISVACETKLQLWCNSSKEEKAHKSKWFKIVFPRSKIQFSQSDNEDDDEEEEELQLDFANPSKCKNSPSCLRLLDFSNKGKQLSCSEARDGHEA